MCASSWASFAAFCVLFRRKLPCFRASAVLLAAAHSLTKNDQIKAYLLPDASIETHEVHMSCGLFICGLDGVLTTENGIGGWRLPGCSGAIFILISEPSLVRGLP